MIPDPKTNEPRRRRIVVNFDQIRGSKAQKPGGRPTRRWPKILGILAVILVIFVGAAVVGGYFWWQHYKTTAVYSLAVLIDAAQRNDTAAVDQSVDTDKIVDNLMGQVVTKAEERYGPALSPDVRKRIEDLVPGPGLKQSVKDALAQRVKEIAAKGDHKPFVIIAITLPHFVSVSTEKDLAKVSATLQDHAIDLTMQRDSGRWKVVALNDDALVQKLVDDVMKDLPAIGSGAEQPVASPKPKPKRRRGIR